MYTHYHNMTPWDENGLAKTYKNLISKWTITLTHFNDFMNDSAFILKEEQKTGSVETHNHSPMEQYQTHILARIWVWRRQANW